VIGGWLDIQGYQDQPKAKDYGNKIYADQP
jgi:hypothetical protein